MSGAVRSNFSSSGISFFSSGEDEYVEFANNVVVNIGLRWSDAVEEYYMTVYDMVDDMVPSFVGKVVDEDYMEEGDLV